MTAPLRPQSTFLADRHRSAQQGGPAPVPGERCRYSGGYAQHDLRNE